MESVLSHIFLASNDSGIEIWIALTVALASAVGLVIQVLYNKRQLKAQYEQLAEDSYSKLRHDHSSLVQLLLHDKTLQKVLNTKNDDEEKNKQLDELSHEHKTIYAYYVMQFDMNERIWNEIFVEEVVKDKEEQKEEWGYWLRWFEKMSDYWLFKYTLDKTPGVWNDKFVLRVKKHFVKKFPDWEKDARELAQKLDIKYDDVNWAPLIQ